MDRAAVEEGVQQDMDLEKQEGRTSQVSTVRASRSRSSAAAGNTSSGRVGAQGPSNETAEGAVFFRNPMHASVPLYVPELDEPLEAPPNWPTAPMSAGAGGSTSLALGAFPGQQQGASVAASHSDSPPGEPLGASSSRVFTAPPTGSSALQASGALRSPSPDFPPPLLATFPPALSAALPEGAAHFSPPAAAATPQRSLRQLRAAPPPAPTPHPSAAELMSQLTSALFQASNASTRARSKLLSTSSPLDSPVRAAPAAALASLPLFTSNPLHRSGEAGGGGGSKAPGSAAAGVKQSQEAEPGLSRAAASAPRAVASSSDSALGALGPAPFSPSAATPAVAAATAQAPIAQAPSADSASRSPLKRSVTFATPPGAAAKELPLSPVLRPEAELANSWVRRWSDAKNSHFFVNLYTRSSVWHEPSAANALIYVETGAEGKLVPVAGKPAMQSGGGNGSSSSSSVYLQKWSAAKSAPFFVNIVTKESSWTPPPGCTIVQDSP